MSTKWIVFITALIIITACSNTNNYRIEKNEGHMEKDSIYLKATFGSGCFWCTEAVFLKVKGVGKVVSGYSGGVVPNPTYEAVTTGKTGHAEVIQLSYDPQIIRYEELLEIFFNTHDPTTLNRQGADIGTQYRSVIFYHDENQKEIAEKTKAILDSLKIWDNPIVTELSPFEKFYAAEDYHQNYYDNNPNQPYCNFVITPKIEKFQKVFKEKLK